ncbi:type II toxin-antitoxin system RelE/ParE family toxin [Pseudidiomarina salilacus]|uniref:type II toxin-antitoxin system RelE/ParE family toxin n=1 Tax=Pseudidiomarina salilacus TaxID=3384452 RepID=UPI003985304C
MLITVVELPEYIKRAERLLDSFECKAVIDYLAEHPKAGDIMVGTGGIRKLRWQCGKKGKSGGVRIIYYFHNERFPLFLLTVFGKSERTNLSKTERVALSNLVKELVNLVVKANYDKSI